MIWIRGRWRASAEIISIKFSTSLLWNRMRRGNRGESLLHRLLPLQQYRISKQTFSKLRIKSSQLTTIKWWRDWIKGQDRLQDLHRYRHLMESRSHPKHNSCWLSLRIPSFKITTVSHNQPQLNSSRISDQISCQMQKETGFHLSRHAISSEWVSQLWNNKKLISETSPDNKIHLRKKSTLKVSKTRFMELEPFTQVVEKVKRLGLRISRLASTSLSLRWKIQRLGEDCVKCSSFRWMRKDQVMQREIELGSHDRQ